MFLISFVFVFYFLRKKHGRSPKISLVDVVPKQENVVDNPKVLYPAVFLPPGEEEEKEEELDGYTIARYIRELQTS